MPKYILALDQGTTSSRAIIYNQDATPIAMAQKEFEQIFPKPGWVEHDPEEIWESQLEVARKVIQSAKINGEEIAGIGITNQRETTVVWNRTTGKPIYNAIVWQDRRTSGFCKELIESGREKTFTDKTGLLIDAYFSGTKINWILKNVKGAGELAKKGELAFGTIDTWLIWKLTNGKSHITDVTNASRTLLFNIHTLEWDEELLKLLNVNKSMLPEVQESSGILADSDSGILGTSIPIAGIAGDQQAALFGQMCIEPGMAKCTYGTGCFLMMNIGNKPTPSKNRLLTTIGWKINGETTYALEGSVFIGGAIVQWLRDGLEFFKDSKESEGLAKTVESSDGVVFVPALAGLGAPHWDSSARGAILGITRGTTKAHITRAALESICFQVEDVLSTMAKDKGKALTQLRIDGGATANDFMVQFQSDISQIEVVRPTNLETTALGAAYLAGLGSGVWTLNELKTKWQQDRSFSPVLQASEAEERTKQWLKGVERSKNWVEDEA
ncbi:MAG: glycerol kinase GlpK [Cyclobacteriaceae bacterium]|nr:glycerol kinase GlpK [Cyclobacteriaceae bacterium]